MEKFTVGEKCIVGSGELIVMHSNKRRILSASEELIVKLTPDLSPVGRRSESVSIGSIPWLSLISKFMFYSLNLWVIKK